MSRRDALHAWPGADRGFGLIELMISLAIASFLVLGLVVMAGNTNRTFATQTDLAAINDKERFAAELLGNAIQTAGYYTMPAVITPTTWTSSIVNATFPIELGTFASKGQVLGGSNGAGSDVLNVRFQANAGDLTAPFNCQGVQNTATAVTESMFQVVNNNLVCSVGTNGAVPANQTVLIDGVSSMNILYGVDIAYVNSGSGLGVPGSANVYVAASNMNAAYWKLVRSVKVTLTFVKPTSLATSATAAAPTYTQIFQVMYETVAN